MKILNWLIYSQLKYKEPHKQMFQCEWTRQTRNKWERTQTTRSRSQTLITLNLHTLCRSSVTSQSWYKP